MGAFSAEYLTNSTKAAQDSSPAEVICFGSNIKPASLLGLGGSSMAKLKGKYRLLMVVAGLTNQSVADPLVGYKLYDCCGMYLFPFNEKALAILSVSS